VRSISSALAELKGKLVDAHPEGFQVVFLNCLSRAYRGPITKKGDEASTADHGVRPFIGADLTMTS
jgi:hypothetical protein